MTPERFRQVGELYHRALGQPPGVRQRFVAENCAGDPDLQAEVESLLAAGAQAEHFLSVPAKLVAAAALTRHPLEELPEIPVPEGQTIGPYRVVRKIGSGGMGHVYLAEDARLGRKVALKCLRTAQAGDPRSFARLEQEARAASALNHPNIVTVYDLIESSGQQFIAAEYIAGETLRERMASGPLPFPQIVEIGVQVANALHAAHAAGIVHGDIKPANIMVREDGLVKVLDFGLASQPSPAAADTQPSPPADTALLGTPLYMSPEQFTRQPLDGRTDIFSLGIVLYELAAGHPPFHGETDTALWYSLLNDPPPKLRRLRPAIPEPFEQLVETALQKEPARRYRSGAELAAALRAIPTSPAKPRHLRRTVIASALALAPLGAISFWLAGPPASPRVLRVTQITGDPGSKLHFVNDGATVYYSRGNEDPHTQLLRVSVNGGEPEIMPQLTGMFPLHISRDGARILAGQYLEGTANGPYPLWIAPVSGGPPTRLGTLNADAAQWSPTEQEIVFAAGSELRVAPANGASSRLLAKIDGLIDEAAWAPDGRSIRFTQLAKNSHTIWEVSTAGGPPRLLLPEWGDRMSRQGAWTPDGQHFVFASAGDLWILPTLPQFFRPPSPVRLTNGPYRTSLPQPSPTGNRIFFIGRQNRGELVRYDRKSDRWLPYLAGLPGFQLNYSRDGQSVTWVGYPDGTVWRSRLDGSERLQLTQPGIRAALPLWSPDSARIAFFGAPTGKPYRVFTVPAAGGEIRQVTNGEAGPGGDVDETWSPDGRKLAFSSFSLDPAGCKCIKLVELATGQVTTLPSTEGLWSPRWSPDGRYIAALGSANVFRLWLYDLSNHSRTALTTTGVGWPAWSPDSRYIYFEDNATSAWFRVGIQQKRIERLANLTDLIMAPSTFGWAGVTPDGELISTRDKGSSEIYSLDWEKR